ncbi:MAG: integration host factor subunit beta [Candidatus Porifericomitaceae bacterium WSBS_2022_MAG_OTU9]
MIKSELIQLLSQKQSQLNFRDVELAVKTIIEQMTLALSRGKRIELRGFGSFCLHKRPERQGRNPMTGEAVHLPVNYVPHFKPGKILRRRVDFPHNNKNRDRNGERD